MTASLVFDIKRGSLDDGPGIRTVVFLKGCPLSCTWCHNPESQCPDAEVFYHREKCVGCGRCLKACPRFSQGVAARNEGGMSVAAGWLSDSECSGCHSCVKACACGALEPIGRIVDVEELLAIVMEDEPYYRISGGGVTFSGGEPLMHMPYVSAVASRLQERSIPVAVETCGLFSWKAFERQVLPSIDLVLFDLKVFDPVMHRRATGRDNRMILENFDRLLACASVRLIPRTPLIPGITDTGNNLAAIRGFLRERGLEDRHILLPFNDAAGAKRSLLVGKK